MKVKVLKWRRSTAALETSSHDHNEVDDKQSRVVVNRALLFCITQYKYKHRARVGSTVLALYLWLNMLSDITNSAQYHLYAVLS